MPSIFRAGRKRQLSTLDTDGVRGFPLGTTGAAIYFVPTGTPEGAVTAIVGSLCTRGDGGANTTLYVKQSGSGNTGWVAK